MTRALVFCAFLCAAVAHSQQVTVRPSNISAIEVVGPQSPEFSGLVAQIVGADQPGGFLAWLPYGVVIRNKSAQALAAVTVMWSASFNGGPMGHAGSTSPAWFGAPKQQIQPGQSLIVMPQSTLLSARDLRRFADGRGTGNLQNFQRADKIEIALDSVVFASGQFAGADTAREYEFFAANLSAPRSVAASVMQKKETASIGDIVSWLQTTSVQRGSRDPNVQCTAGAARRLLSVYNNRGEAALYQTAQDTLSRPAFPLHR